MTENTTPENLLKFLHSEDSATVTMGLSMSKSIELNQEILGKYSMDLPNG